VLTGRLSTTPALACVAATVFTSATSLAKALMEKIAARTLGFERGLHRTRLSRGLKTLVMFGTSCASWPYDASVQAVERIIEE
jgi:hypothetical protein